MSRVNAVGCTPPTRVSVLQVLIPQGHWLLLDFSERRTHLAVTGRLACYHGSLNPGYSTELQAQARDTG
ncbi:hypothetical protein EYF80_053440 [Liparis tanakae]|uniref:Uncharacterized protein n=1 Tax=Liparis tanakae TaxID=230148 RepID=A0A4Z2F6A2_9TELE|nr:hypothetical protein EYF80_053440 [Liparis tanakae]